MAKNFKDLSEREIVALAISLEEEDGRIYGDFIDGLRNTYPASAKMFEEMQKEEAEHRDSLIETFRASNFFGVNILAEEQQALSDTFARKGHDRFQGISWRRGQFDVPLIEGALAGIELQVEQRIPVGDHDIFVGRMVATHVRDGAPLLHFRGAYRKMQL